MRRLQADFDFQKTLALLRLSDEHSRAVIEEIHFRSLKSESGRKWYPFMKTAMGRNTECHDPNNN